MKTVEELDVFKLAHELTLKVFEITKTFPHGEKFGIVSQMRRAAYSIPYEPDGRIPPIKF